MRTALRYRNVNASRLAEMVCCEQRLVLKAKHGEVVSPERQENRRLGERVHELAHASALRWESGSVLSRSLRVAFRATILLALVFVPVLVWSKEVIMPILYEVSDMMTWPWGLVDAFLHGRERTEVIRLAVFGIAEIAIITILAYLAYRPSKDGP
jgi:hypothetical protein